MRILYGVDGEGMGHATRSKVVCEHLVSQGHEVKIVVSGRAHAFLSKSFPDVVEIKGLTLKYVDNAMAKGGSLAQNLLAAPSLLYENVNAYYEKVIAFDPHAVITDFDSFAYLFGKRHRLPVLSIDNQQIICRCKHGPRSSRAPRSTTRLTKAFVKGQAPGVRALPHHDLLLPEDPQEVRGHDHARPAHPPPVHPRREEEGAPRRPRARLPDLDERQAPHSDAQQGRKRNASSSTA
jgi:UDP:flavonoid glycosyltransferase YjiC (YdhE family)